jgi:hypothetical protein
MKEEEIIPEITSKPPNIQIDTKPSKTRVPFGSKRGFKHHRTRCFKCHSYKRYENPMAMCWECRNKFCYNHIWGGLVKEGMKDTEEVRHICDPCKDEHGYKTLE